ncbi:MAG: PorV/PorQ family protein [Candidatus Eisenbacteria bacterium]|nr:PorV/PorQ family protein [Candidatus Eisenbacteria bacterium]
MKRSILAILSVICLIVPTVASAEEGSAGLAFLRLGVGARAIGMGDAYTAVSGDASSVYWNPAGIIDVQSVDVTLMHSEWFQDIRYEYIGGVRSYGDYAIGGGITGLYMNDLERRVGPTADPIGHFGVFDFAVTGSYARRLTDYLDVGGSLKYLHERIDDENATGVAVDLGGRYRLPGYEHVTAAVALLNLGPQMKFVEEKFDLPVTYKIGAALDVPVEALHGDFVIASDAVIPADGSTKVHFGIEYEYAEMLAFRFGYRTGWDNHDVSWGLGVKVRNFRLDYAMVPFYSELGDTHRISLGIML